jgi:microsomal epoxide hydrolase
MVRENKHCRWTTHYSTEIFRIGEKFLEWVDDAISPEAILESVTLYWLTETFPRAIYPYRQVRFSRERSLLLINYLKNYPPLPIPASNDPRWYIKKPFGFSSFPMELAPVPRSWVETTGNLKYWERHQEVTVYSGKGPHADKYG